MSNDLVAAVSKAARHLGAKGGAYNAFIGAAKNARSPTIIQLEVPEERRNEARGGRDDAAQQGDGAVDSLDKGAAGTADVAGQWIEIAEGEDIAVGAGDEARGRIDEVGKGSYLSGYLSSPPPYSGGANGATGKNQNARNQKPNVAVKDNIATNYSETTCASGILKDYVSPYEATVVRRLRSSPFDASETRTYLEFDYVVGGKTNMDEFGMGSHSTNSYFGPVTNRNPWRYRSAGGSSGGSALAVASNVRDFALGTDTGGSVRLPAAYNGVVGFKPSYGRISRWGVIPYANSLDTVGILAPYTTCQPKLLGERHSPLSLRNFFKRVEGYDPRDPTSLTNSSRLRARSRIQEFAKSSRRWGSNELKRLRIGVPIEYNINELHRTVRDTWKGVLKGLRSDGHKIVPVSLPSTKHALSAYYVLAAAEAASNLAKYDGVRYGTRAEGSDGSAGVLYATTRGNGFGDEVKRRILLGSYTLSSEAIDNYFIQAQKVRRLVQRDFDRVFAIPNPLHQEEQFDLSEMDEDIRLDDKRGPPQIDVLVCPTAPTLPPLLEEVNEQASVDAYMNDVFTVPASLAGLPAISVPVQIPKPLQTKDNVPFIGIQVIGQYWDDFHVMNVGGMICSRPADKMFAWQKPEWKPPEPVETPINDKITTDNGALSGEEMVLEYMPQREGETPIGEGIAAKGEMTSKEEKSAGEEKHTENAKPTEESAAKEEPVSPRFNGRPIVRKWLSPRPYWQGR